MDGRHSQIAVRIETLESRRMLAGVTLITHGFQFSSGLPGWQQQMEASLAARMNGANVYRMTITGSTPAVSSLQKIATGPGDNAQTVISLNWSAVSNNFLFPSVGGDDIAAVVKPYLTNALNLPGDPATTRSFAELPIHLIGHSRGGSVVAELAEQLAADGVWVDQLTLLDAHPTGPDPAISLADNAVFIENLYQDNVFPDGNSASGAHNINLTPTDMDHSAVHRYYHGTIARAATSDGDGTINDTWYTQPGTGPRASVGYDWSHVVGGARPSGGVSNLGSGAAARSHVNVTTYSPYSNIGSLVLNGSASGDIEISDLIQISYRYQDSAGGGTIDLYLDDNANPYDTPARHFGAVGSLSGTGATPNVSSPQSFPMTWSSSGLSEGLYRVSARISNTAGRQRFAYMDQALYVTEDGARIISKRWSGDVSGDWTEARNWTPGGVPAAGDRVAVTAATPVTTTLGSPATSVDLLAGTLNWAGGAFSGDVTIAGSAGMTINGGANGMATNLTLRHSATATFLKSMQLASLHMETTAKLDLVSNALIVHGGSLSEIESLVTQGFNGGDWLGSGITSSLAANDTSFVTALGSASNDDLGYSEFAGFSGLDGDEILVKYTYYGDADLGGTVNLDDFTQFLFGYNNGVGGPPAIWLNGDFDFNGSVNLDDFTQFLSGLQNQTAPLMAASLDTPSVDSDTAANVHARSDSIEKDTSRISTQFGLA